MHDTKRLAAAEKRHETELCSDPSSYSDALFLLYSTAFNITALIKPGPESLLHIRFLLELMTKHFLNRPTSKVADANPVWEMHCVLM